MMVQRGIFVEQQRMKIEEEKMTKTYEAPKVITLDNNFLLANLGPSISCTGFGGAASGSSC